MHLAQLIEYELEMFLVLFDRVAIDKYIIKIYVYESSNIISENNSHEPLECSRRITVPLLHSMAHECAINGSKHCFPYIFGFHAYLLICVRHINQRFYVFLCIIIAFVSIDDGAKFHCPS
jgi:hypothetical protein